MQRWTVPCPAPLHSSAGEDLGCRAGSGGIFGCGLPLALLGHVLMLQGKYHRCLMALEIAVSPSLPAQGVVRGAECGGLRGAGALAGMRAAGDLPGEMFLLPWGPGEIRCFLIRVFRQSSYCACPGRAWGGDAGLCWVGRLCLDPSQSSISTRYSGPWTLSDAPAVPLGLWPTHRL